ncbi:MAG: HD-GYP domain-containing protein [candidate division WOR-3 bacterium]|nr:HD-GYP domain-containing protein [candidate division WOR-3 bacterium]
MPSRLKKVYDWVAMEFYRIKEIEKFNLEVTNAIFLDCFDGRYGYVRIIKKKDRLMDNAAIISKLVRTIEILDSCTKEHSLQVSMLAFELGKFIAFSPHELEMIKCAGLLHDIGKVAVPEKILNKPAPLNEKEWMIMKRHPVISAEIIMESKELREIEPWILYHHERWDGKGYPEGRKGREIPVVAMILAVCDAYSAMTSDRPYRQAMSTEEARNEIKNFREKQFNPDVVDVFLSLPTEILEGFAKNQVYSK